MKKVTLIHNCWLSAKNGANTVMNLLLANKKLFAKNGIEISRCTYDDIEERNFLEPSKNRNNIKFRLRTFIKKTLMNLSKYSGVCSVILIKNGDIKSAVKIANKYLASLLQDDEVVFFHSITPCYYYLKNRKIDQPTVLVMHTNGETLKMEREYCPKLVKTKFYKQLILMEEYTIEHVDKIVFVAKNAADNFIKLHPQVESEKVHYVYNGEDISPEINRISLSSPIEIICVASISGRKGQQFIIEALENLKAKNKLPNIHFTFVGDGYARATLESRVCDARLEKYVSFLGVRNDVDELLKKSDIYILASKDEGLPMAIIEAMRASLPIVSTNVGGIPEMIDNNYNGLLITPDVTAVQHFIENIDSYDWLQMGKNSREIFMNKFTVEKMVEGYSKILTDF